MRVVSLTADHVARLRLQPMQALSEPAVTHKEAEALASQGKGYAAVGEDGTVYAVAGILPQWEGRAIAWAMVAYNAGPHMVRITREIKRFLDECGYRRVEASVDAFFPQAHRWIRMLGFECETPEPMRGYGYQGRAAFLYARVVDA